ncbi:MAG: phosphoglycerate dehydrogenase [Candidatus Omnitrophica bacterium]|nr:phosphoglycerate dehydrogenase [Candidatus Omnitrophota bacterium]
MKILVTDPLSEEGIELMKSANQVTVDVKTKLKTEELLALIGEYDGLVVRSGTQVTKDLLERAKRLKVIGRAGAGLDNIDVETASKRGIIVMNAAGGNTISTAEHTMSLILSLARNIPQASSSLKGGQWNRSAFMGVELYGKHLGVVGLGRIGSEVAKRALGFGMRVIVYDPYLSEERARELEAEPVARLEDLLKRADFITFHTPLTDETRALLGAKQFALVKKGVRVVNCARGGIVDEKALAEAIKSGQVAGAALDVFEQEPPKNQELLSLPQVIVTPHLGASTEEAQRNVATEIAVSVRDYLLGLGVRNAVNVPSVEPEVLKLIDPYLKLIERMGTLQAQLAEGRLREVRIRYIGDLTRLELAPLTIAFVKGLLTPALQETVNYVNAALIAKERGIKVIESKAAEGADFANLISTLVETDRGKAEVHGAFFSRTDPRIVQINDFRVEAVPSGAMMLIRNQDKPGMIGQVGTALGSKGINISSMTFGRKSQGGEALLVLNLDQSVTPEVLEAIKKLPGVIEVKLIKL